MTAATSDQVRDLQRQLDDLRDETRLNNRSIAVAIRRTRLNLTTIEHDESIRRLRQPTSLLDWHPRGGKENDPNVGGGLIDRLRQGNPIADTLGNVDPIPGQSNLLDEPAFEGYSLADVALTGVTATVGHPNSPRASFGTAAWVGRTAAGTAATCTTKQAAPRLSQSLDPFNSAAVDARIRPTGAGTHEIQIDGFGVALGALPWLPYLIGGIRVGRMVVNDYTNVTSRTLSIEILDTTSNLVRATRTYDLTSLSDTVLDQIPCFVALDYSSLGAVIMAHSFAIRVRLTIVSTAATGDVTVWLGDPMMHFSRSPDPAAYTPAIAGWEPTGLSHPHGAAVTTTVIGAKLFADTNTRWRLRADGSILWGGGGATEDAQLYRAAAGNLFFDSNGAAASTSIQLEATAGQRSLLSLRVAGDTVSRIALAGDASVVGMEWGSGAASRDLRLARTGAKALTLDDTAGGAVTFNVKGTLQQTGTGVSVAGHGAADHADITRKLFLPASEAKLDGATAANLGASANLLGVVAYADAVTSGAFWAFEVPADWASGVITIQPVWVPGASDGTAHTVRWSMTCKTMAAGVTVTAAGTTAGFTGASAARTINVVVYDTATSTTLTPAAAGDLFMVELQRMGADLADSYVGVVNVVGLIVSYTATQ